MKALGRTSWVLSLAWLLTGCALPTPLPVSPIQVLAGDWPRLPPASAQRAYTIKGDTFTFTEWGVALTRPSQADWEFLPGANAVTVRYRGEAAEPVPSLMVQVIPVDPETDLAASVAADQETLVQQGAKVTVASRPVAGVDAPDLAIEQTEDETVIAVRRTYVQVGGMLVVIQSSGTKADIEKLKAELDAMIESLSLSAQ